MELWHSCDESLRLECGLCATGWLRLGWIRGGDQRVIRDQDSGSYLKSEFFNQLVKVGSIYLK